jgi:hypothetical protein
MKKILVLTALLSTLMAQKAEFGVGIIAGEPTGISIKHWLPRTVDLEAAAAHIGSLAQSWWSTKSIWLPRKNAWDGAIAWSLFNEGQVHLHADYLWHDYTIFPPDLGIMPVYYGVGGCIRLGSGDKTRLGLRGVIGVNYLFEKLPLDAFMELAPVFNFVPNTDLEINVAVGIRYFFRQSLSTVFD